jgi:hypothetical protein
MPAERHVVALIHGIRTEAAWAERIKSVLEQHAGATVEPLKYGYFDVFRFLCPVFTRGAAVSEIHEKLRSVREYNRDSDISIVAHSFGTYIITSILRSDPFFKVNRMILCGSVVHRRFPWSRVAHQVIDKKVLNECGTRDVWPVLARTVTYGYGPTGTFGFGDPKVRDRFHRTTHGGFFDAEFVEAFWVPYIADGRIDGTEWEKDRPAPPFWLSVLPMIPIRWVWWIWVPAAGAVYWLL